MRGRWKVIPVRVDGEQLIVAGPDPPTPEMQQELQGSTSLRLRFHLVTPANYRRLVEVAG